MQERVGNFLSITLWPCVLHFFSFINLFIYITRALAFSRHACLYEDLASIENGGTDNCEWRCVCWDLNPGPVEEKSVLLTAEPFSQTALRFLFSW